MKNPYNKKKTLCYKEEEEEEALYELGERYIEPIIVSDWNVGRVLCICHAVLLADVVVEIAPAIGECKLARGCYLVVTSWPG